MYEPIWVKPILDTNKALLAIWRNVWCTMNCPIRPLFNQIVIDRFDEEPVTQGGIIRPVTHMTQRGRVLAVGQGKKFKNGTRIPVNINIGDVIQYRPHAIVVKHFINGKKYIMVSEDEILAVI